MMEKQTKLGNHMIECDVCGDAEESSKGLSWNDAMQEFKDEHGYTNVHDTQQGWKNLCASCAEESRK
jgi:hypothetical protein